jgi:hypothetical protein
LVRTHLNPGRTSSPIDADERLLCARSGRSITAHYALGYCGTGVWRSTYFGRKVALKILGDAEGNIAFDDMLLPGHPLHMFAKATAPLVEGWYRLRDVGNF